MQGKKAYNWDSMRVVIEYKDYYFFFNMKNSRAYFYFNMYDQWYKTKIVTDKGLDLWDYIEKHHSLFKYYDTK
jgi:hypothetical protein